MTEMNDPGRRPGIAGEAAQAAKAEAAGAWRDARQAAGAKIEQGKDSAAKGLEQVAGALHEGAQRSQGDSDTVANVAGATADALERMSRALRSSDVGSMLRKVESFSREQPMVLFGVALAAGFVAVRAMRAADRREHGEHHEHL